MKKSYTKWGIIVFSCITSAVLIFFFRGSDIDQKYVSNLNNYELAYKEIKNEYAKLLVVDEPNYRSSEGVIVDFRFNQSEIKQLKTPVLHDLFKSNLIKEVIITKNGGILFQLKTCSFEDCEDHPAGFSGPYVHYLSKDRIEFIHEKWVRVIEEKTIGNWTYYVVWTQKG